ncbi:MAG: sulfatase [Bacteroidota bacterium]
MRLLLRCCCLALSLIWACNSPSSATQEVPPPNVILIYMDDLGYGDLSHAGHPTIHTPNIDRMAREGQRWTQFYTACSVCSPSRGALLTGRYPIRIGLGAEKRRVFFPPSIGGLPQAEITLAEMLKEIGYRTSIIGKWHLGHTPEYLPTQQGFDEYYGIPYSNDMDAVKWGLESFFAEPDYQMWKVPLMKNDSIIERPANQFTITRRYTEQAVSFIQENQDTSFFLYLPHSMVHTPLFASDSFQNTSPRGLFGDVMAEVDWSVGQILETLEALKLDKRTLVIFSSDNGPWLSMLEMGGSAGLLRDGKGTTWEGGMRVPGIFYMPGTVKPGPISGLGSTLDILPTLAALTGAPLPEDRVLDGYDLSEVLTQRKASPRDHFFYYRKREIYAVRKGPYKAHFVTETCYQSDNNRQEWARPLLFHLDHDPSEKYDHGAEHPEILSELTDLVRQHQTGWEGPPSEMEKYPAQ